MLQIKIFENCFKGDLEFQVNQFLKTVDVEGSPYSNFGLEFKVLPAKYDSSDAIYFCFVSYHYSKENYENNIEIKGGQVGAIGNNNKVSDNTFNKNQ
jgi:hypothetical protein